MQTELGIQLLSPEVVVGEKTMKVSDKIRTRIIEAEAAYMANDSIAHLLQPGETDELKIEIQSCIENLLDALLINRTKDPNTRDTGARVARMFIDEVMMGRFHKKPALTIFPNTKKLDQIYTIGPVEVRSMCSHHLVPILGQVWVGVIPGQRLIGLSKFNRLAHWIFSRPQIQEEAAIQLADALEEELQPTGVALVVKADHMCMHWRGVKDHSSMTNSIMRGVFLANPSAKQEFLELIKGQGYTS